jgi:hypothetical protein
LQLLQNLFEIVLRKEQKITNDEVGLVGEGLNIWTSFVAFHPKLL